MNYGGPSGGGVLVRLGFHHHVRFDAAQFRFVLCDVNRFAAPARPALAVGEGRSVAGPVDDEVGAVRVAVEPFGLPLGLAALRFWTRRAFNGTNARKKRVNPTRVPIEEKESYRWLENLARTQDPPPGNMVIWWGFGRLADLCQGYELANQVVGK